MRPLVAGWYAVVLVWVDPRICMRCFHNADSNCHRRSAESGNPAMYKCLSHCRCCNITDGNGLGPTSEAINNSRRYLNPCDGGRGPTISR